MGSDSRPSKRRKKHSQKHSKKSRSTKEKSKTKKPIKRRHDSDSSSGEDVPCKLPLSCSSSSSSSSSSSEDVYRRIKKRGRSRDRSDRKSSKKKTKRGRSMSDTSIESPRVKKKRKSKSIRDSKLKKKKHRKVHRRKRSISSSSSPSRNSSASECSDDSGRENERKGEKSEMKKRRGREMSCSPCNDNEERMDCQPKRLKSVIVAEIEKDEPKVEELIRDTHEDEIVYDHDDYDYPSKSNDSYDGPSAKDAVTYSDDKIRTFEDPNREVISPVVGTCEPGISGDVSVGSTIDNLEAKLRQKALENLLKRRANVSTDKKDYHPAPHERVLLQTELQTKSDVKPSSPLQNELVGNQTNNQTSALGTKNNNNNNPVPRYSIEKGDVSVGHSLIRPKVGLTTSTRRFVGSSNTWRREPVPQEPPLKPTQTLTKEAELTKGGQSEVVKVENTSGKSEVKEDEDSEFQQKTMTVMRGGELVQVSYKVKIPKKAPALARRQLKR